MIRSRSACGRAVLFKFRITTDRRVRINSVISFIGVSFLCFLWCCRCPFGCYIRLVCILTDQVLPSVLCRQRGDKKRRGKAAPSYDQLVCVQCALFRIKPVSVHHLYPGVDKITGEFALIVVLGIDFRQSPQLRV